LKIPNYEIIKQIGSGGMGTVFLAEHTLIKRKVAIKSLNHELISNEHLRIRFKKEAIALAQMEHPNIVRLNEYLEQQDGIFLIMEYVDGLTLDEHINKVSGPINEDELVPLFIQLLEAFEYAHQNKIVHRDIKPSNIIITKGSKIKVLDFGIAKIMDETSSMTKTGTQMGTVFYMSPEQVRGEKVNHLSDIYSLGVTLFQMATGNAPYDPTSNEYQVFQKIDKEPLPNAFTIYPGVSEKLNNIIQKATTKDSKDRFQSCDEFKTALLNIENETTNTKAKIDDLQKTVIKEIPKEKKKKKNLIILFLIALIGAASLFIYQYYQSLPKQYTYYYNKGWATCEKDSAEFYRIISLDNEGNPVGIVKDFFISGEIQWEGYLSYFDSDSSENDIMDSICIFYYKSGKKEIERFYNEGILNGTYKNWDETGKLRHTANYINDSLNGYGKFDYGFWGDSIKYEGNLKANIFDGQGTMTSKSGTAYVGEWKNGYIHGQGTTTFPNGDKYVGKYEYGRMHGKGTYTNYDGSIFHNGLWDNDLPTGCTDELACNYCDYLVQDNGTCTYISNNTTDIRTGTWSIVFKWQNFEEWITRSFQKFSGSSGSAGYIDDFAFQWSMCGNTIKMMNEGATYEGFYSDGVITGTMINEKGNTGRFTMTRD